MQESGSVKDKSIEKPQSWKDDLYRVFLSGFDPAPSRSPDEKPDGCAHERSHDLAHLFLEEFVGLYQLIHDIEKTFREVDLREDRRRPKNKFENLDKISTLRRKLRHLEKTLKNHGVSVPDSVEIPSLFEEVLNILSGELQGRGIDVRCRFSEPLPPVHIRRSPAVRGLFEFFRSILGIGSVDGIDVSATPLGDTCLVEILVKHPHRAIDRGLVDLTGLLGLSIREKVALDWESTPGRFILRMEFPSPSTRRPEESAESVRVRE
jgi:hypothetical protein